MDDGGQSDQGQVGLTSAGRTRSRSRTCGETGGEIHLERDEKRELMKREKETAAGGSVSPREVVVSVDYITG